MSDSEDDDVPREKVKKRLLQQAGRQSSKQLNYKGVKSYLHQFYDFATDARSPAADDRQLYIKSHRIRVRSLWWRVFLYSGALLMVVGAVAFLVSFAIPPHVILVDVEADVAVMDHDAAAFNHNLDLLRLAGLATFCIGGVSSSLALLVASCCFRCCGHLELRYEDIEPESMVKKLVEEDAGEEEPPLSPVESRVPGLGALLPVQPTAVDDGAAPYPIPVIKTSPTSDYD